MTCLIQLRLPGMVSPANPSGEVCLDFPPRIPSTLLTNAWMNPWLFPQDPASLPNPPAFRMETTLTPSPLPYSLLRPTPPFSSVFRPGFMFQRAGATPPGLPRTPLPVSAADIYRQVQSMGIGDLPNPASSSPPPVDAQAASLSPNESPWVQPIVTFLGRFLASADIRLSGVPANAGADGLVPLRRTEEQIRQGIGEQFPPPSADLRCRYTEFANNHHFPTEYRDLDGDGIRNEPYVPTCNDAEYSHRPECAPGSRYVCFTDHTTATVTIRVREIENTSESIIHHLAFEYDQHPRVIAERVPGLREIPGLDRVPAFLLRGFYGNDPAGTRTTCRSSLEQTVCEGRVGPVPVGQSVPRPGASYLDLQYAFESPQPDPSLPAALQAAPPPPSSVGPLAQPLVVLEWTPERGVGRNPLQQLLTAFATATHQDMIDGFLESFGLNGLESGLYRSLGVPVGGLPRSVHGFLTLVRPLFTADTRARLDRQSTTWNPNMILDNNPLFYWSQTGSIRIDGLLRGGDLPLPNAGTYRLDDSSSIESALRADQTALDELPREGNEEEVRLRTNDLQFRREWLRTHPTQTLMNRLRVRGDSDSLEVTLGGVSFSEGTIPLPPTPNQEEAGIDFHHLLADRVSVELPPLNDLMSDAHIDPRPVRSIRLENPYLSTLTVRYGTITVNLRNVRAQRISYELPSPSEIREQNIPADQLFRRGHFVINGLQADSLTVENPLYRLNVDMRDIRMQIDEQSTPAEGVFGTSTGGTQSLPFRITSLSANQISASVGGVGSVSARASEIRDLNLSMGTESFQAQIGSIHSSGSIDYNGTGAQADTHVQLTGESTIDHFRLGLQYPEGGPRNLTVDFGINTTIGAGTLRFTSASEVSLREGSLRNATFHSETTFPEDPEGASTYLNRIEGDLSLRFDRFGLRSDFNIPGFSLDGSFENVLLSGRGRITYGNDQYAFERPADSSTPFVLQGEIRETRLRHDPSQSDPRLRRTPHHEVVETDATIHHATIRIDDFVRFASVPVTAEGQQSHHEVDFRGLRITDLQSAGEVWAPLAPWRYLRAILSVGGNYIPLQRGRPLRPLPAGGDCRQLPGGIPADISSPENFIYLGRWASHPNDRGRSQSTIQDYRACIHSEPLDQAGSRPFVVLGIPELNINPGHNPIVTSGDQPIHFDACMLDLLRGGWICLTPAPRH